MTRPVPPLTVQADKIIRELEGLGDRVATKYLRNGVRAGAAVVRDRAKELAADDPQLKRALTIKARRYRRGTPGGPTASVGYRKGSVGRRRAHWREFGTAVRMTRAGVSRGRVTARPVLRPAYDTTREQVYVAIYDRVRRDLERDYGRGR